MSDGAALSQQRALRALLDEAIDAHDRRTQGIALWLGAEPTFTDRSLETPEWLSEASGSDKEERARSMITRLRERSPGAVVLRPLGRQYPNESLPRFVYGLYACRDGQPLWSGPVDHLNDGIPVEANPEALAALRDALCAALGDVGWFAQACETHEPTTRRFVCRPDGQAVCCDPAREPRLARASIHGCRVEGAGVADELAVEGSYLVLIHAGLGGDQHNAFWLELPAFYGVPELTKFLQALSSACAALCVPSLGLRGFVPPVDETIAWTTLTPDPAVLEVNQAPQPTLRDFLHAEERTFQLAAEADLSPYRLHYNGEVSDSGGGGQLTFGGPSPQQSPFFTCPALLPRLIRYVIRHPALSYWFATSYVGASSQSPRADEGVSEAFLELEIALEQLGHIDQPTPQTLWSTLRHFLADASGNPHRSELNIEKLDNPFVPGRGRLGLVEFRALSMAGSVEDSVARALLFRSIMAMLMREDRAPRLVRWGDVLHDRFALPFYLRRDLAEVFADLASADLGLGPGVEAMLFSRPHAVLCQEQLSGHRLRVEQALEFWPLVGDVASQEGGGSRIVDASTSRLELSLAAPCVDAAMLDEFEVTANGVRVPMRTEPDAHGATRVFGVRYRSFLPWTGIHPTMPAESCITLTLRHPSLLEGLRAVLHPWKPSGGPYDGLPRSLSQAEARRVERAVTERVEATQLPFSREPESHALTPYCLDLRRLAHAG